MADREIRKTREEGIGFASSEAGIDLSPSRIVKKLG